MRVPGTVSSILTHKKASTCWPISPDATVFEAVRMMAEKNIGALPVMDRGKMVGIITERDYSRKIVLRNRTSKDTLVRDIMATTVITVTTHDAVSDCFRLMTEHRVRHLPVVEKEQLIGIVSIGDLVNWVISAQSATIDNLEGYISGRYPG
ncbi:MAG: CBS domain-containing protein [Opitutae bacterium]|nr:CBS domain-containing protein [Opitutae bacterium]